MSVSVVTEATFEQDVIERSKSVPVVVDFWAEWCGPCRSLGPILERLAAEADGAWILAKVDVDTNPALTSAAGVQGIPAVRAFRDGKQVAEFVGALPEEQVRSWLAQLGPSPADLTFSEGEAAEASGDRPAAADAYRAALNLDPGHRDATAALARVELSLRASDSDVTSLREQHVSRPDDPSIATELADAYAVQGDLTSAFEVLLATIGAAVGDDRDVARKHLLSLMSTVDANDPRVIDARKSLTRLVF